MLVALSTVPIARNGSVGPPAGESARFGSLVRALSPRLFRQAMAIVRDAGTAEDVLQQAWLAIWRGRGRWPREEVALHRYCLRAVINHARNAVRDRALRRARESAANRLVDPAGTDTDAAEQWLAAEAWQMALKLPPAWRDVLVLRFGYGLSQQETAARLGRPQGTVAVWQQRALARLRERLEQRTGAAALAPVALLAGAAQASVPSLHHLEATVMASLTSKSAGPLVGIVVALLMITGAAVLIPLLAQPTPAPPPGNALPTTHALPPGDEAPDAPAPPADPDASQASDDGTDTGPADGSPTQPPDVTPHDVQLDELLEHFGIDPESLPERLPAGFLIGRVTDTAGKPVSGATIHILKVGRGISAGPQTVQSDEMGAWGVGQPGLPPSQYRLQVRLGPDHTGTPDVRVNAPVAETHITLGAELKRVDFVVPALATVRVSVTVDGPWPAGGVVLRLVPEEWPELSRGWSHDTDLAHGDAGVFKDGAFTAVLAADAAEAVFAGIPAGDYTLRVDQAELVPMEMPLGSVTGERQVMATLTTGETLRVTVVGPDGPVAGAAVLAAGRRQLPRSATTGPDGGAVLGGLEAGELKVSVRDARYARYDTTTTLPAPQGLDVLLDRGPTLECELRHADGRLATGAGELTVRQASGAVRTVPINSGRTTISGLQIGDVTISGTSQQHGEGGVVIPLRWTLAPQTVAIRGQHTLGRLVVSDTADLTVACEGTAGSTILITDWRPAGGDSFHGHGMGTQTTIRGCPVGPGVLTVRDATGNCAVRPMELTGPTTVTIDFAEAGGREIIVRPTTTAGEVAAVHVRLTTVIDGQHALMQLATRVGNGNVFTGIPPGDYELAFVAHGDTLRREPLRVVAGDGPMEVAVVVDVPERVVLGVTVQHPRAGQRLAVFDGQYWRWSPIDPATGRCEVLSGAGETLRLVVRHADGRSGDMVTVVCQPPAGGGALAVELDARARPGVPVAAVSEAATRTGADLRAGDRIGWVSGVAVNTPVEFWQQLWFRVGHSDGGRVPLDVWRAGALVASTLTVGDPAQTLPTAAGIDIGPHD